MCQAIQEMIEDGRTEGRTENQAEIVDSIKKQQASGISAEQILQEVIKKPGKNARPRQTKKKKTGNGCVIPYQSSVFLFLKNRIACTTGIIKNRIPKIIGKKLLYLIPL